MVPIKKLVADWIQFLKNNQIVAQQPDPKSKTLKYQKPVTAELLRQFLEVKTDFDENAVDNAIKTVLSAKKGQSATAAGEPDDTDDGSDERGLSTWMQSEIRPYFNTSKQVGHDNLKVGHDAEQGAPELGANPAPKRIGSTPGNKQLPHDPNTVSDVEYRDVPNEPEKKEPPQLSAPPAKKKPRFKYSYKRGIQEAFKDKPADVIDEKDVQQVFKLLTNPAPKAQLTAPPKELDLEALNRIKRLIRDTMNDGQRAALWRALTEPMNEAQMSSADAKALLKAASTVRSSGIRSHIPGLRKDNVELSDLRKAWQETGFSDDTRDITAILKDQGFSRLEINKVFKMVLGDKSFKDGEGDPNQIETIKNLVKYINTNGMADEVKDFLSKSYKFSESTDYFGTLVVEDIKKIFELILSEDRPMRQELINAIDTERLGRHKK